MTHPDDASTDGGPLLEPTGVVDTEIDAAVPEPIALDELTESALFRGVHPIGWVAGAVLIAAALCHSVVDTKYLIGNFEWFHWAGFGLLVGPAIKPELLHRLRVLIERFASVTKTIAWVLAWAVFVFQLFNVVTRYGNDLVDTDILFGEVVSLATMSFGLMFLLGINYGVRDGVNPRIDFWWANFSAKTKAWLDFVIHTTLFVPFIWMAIRLLQPYSAGALGRKFNGEWPSGARVWESWEQSSNAGELPVGPIKAMMLVAFSLLALQIIAELIKTGFVMMGDKTHGELKESDAPLRIE